MPQLKVFFTYPEDARKGWEKEFSLGQIPKAGDLLTGPPPEHDLYVVSAVAWNPWGIAPRRSDGFTREEGHVTVFLRPLTTETDYLIESLGKTYEKMVRENRIH